MKCDICGIKEAILFVRQVSSKNTVELHLCAECAKERGVSTNNEKIEMSLGNLLSGLLDKQNLPVKNKVCEVCGQSLTDILKYKKAGCPECYTTFTAEISDAMQKEGIEGPYTGSMPNQLLHFRSPISDRLILQNKLDDAIAREDYEKAAVYRDRLRVIEKSGITDFIDDDSDNNESKTIGDNE